MKSYVKRIFAILAVLVLTVCCLSFGVSARSEEGLVDDVKDAVSTAKDAAEDIMTDIKDVVDPSGNSKPEAEEDGIVDDDRETEKPKETQRETDGTEKETAESKRPEEETTGVIEGMELEEKGINPWAIAIAVLAVIAVLVLIIIFIPKRR